MYLWSCCTARHVLLAGRERRADRMHARDERRRRRARRTPSPHARHHAHAHDDVRGIGELDADVRDRGADRPHRERHDVQRAPAHAAVEEAPERRAHLGRGDPVVGRAGVLLVREQMNVRSSTRATSVGSERARKLAGRFAGLSRIIVPARTISSHNRVLALRAVAPMDVVGLRERRDLATHSIARAWRT